jgi:soluble lytic murein transglycosylase-like protein
VAAWGSVPVLWRRLLALAVVAATVVLAVLGLRALLGDDEPPPLLAPASGEPPGSGAAEVDPLAWSKDRSAEFARAAARGLAHPLYEHSPGGAVATAQRVARYRPLIDAVARQAGLDADTIEGMVFLESAGRPDVAADPQLEGAVGLTQILAETGRNLLRMRVDPAAARRLGRSIRRNEARGRDAVVQRLRARRRAVDQRFDPVASLRATARYLGIAKRELGRDDMAVVSYHMGIGNLQAVLRDYGSERVPYVQLFFDVTPLHHPAAYARLSSFGDDSSTYLWRVRAAENIMRLWRDDPAALERLEELHAAKDSAEEVLHPPGSKRDGDPAEPPRERLAKAGVTIDGSMRLRPDALALLEYVGTGVRAISGAAPLVVSGDEEGTGYTFEVRRDYVSGGQARAFQFLLDRLVALNLIAWVREAAAIRVTVASGAAELLRLR